MTLALFVYWILLIFTFLSTLYNLPMPATRKIPVEDAETVRRYIIESMQYEDIASIYNTTRQTVYNYVNNILGGKYTNISKESLMEMIKQEQSEHKQTHGFSLIKSALALQGIRVQDHFLRELIREAVPELVEIRNPRTGIRNINGPFPLLAAGPMWRVHYDQYEKLWPYGIMIYGGRGRFSRYIISCGVVRNKSASSILLIGKAGFEHMRGALPLTAQFDCGLEPADLQKFLMENIGPDCIYQGECKQNTVIEGFWRILHHGCIWIFRLQLYHLQILLLLDIVNPLHLSCVWFTFAHDVQDKIDEYVSTYNAKKIRKQNRYGIPSKRPQDVMRSFFKDLSGGNFLSVIPPTIISAEYNEYVEKVNEFVAQNTAENQNHVSIRLPSELWITENEIQELPTEEDPFNFGETVHLDKEDWNDADVKNIMKGRRNDIVCEYLTVIGQQMRHELVEGIMFQLINVQLFENESHYRMFKYVICRAATECLLMNNNIEIRIYPNEQINDKLSRLHHEILIGWEEQMQYYNVSSDQLIHPDLF
eukprot:101510_1